MIPLDKNYEIEKKNQKSYCNESLLILLCIYLDIFISIKLIRISIFWIVQINEFSLYFEKIIHGVVNKDLGK